MSPEEAMKAMEKRQEELFTQVSEESMSTIAESDAYSDTRYAGNTYARRAEVCLNPLAFSLES